MEKYVTPDFDITSYEIKDIITASSLIIGDQDPNGGDGSGWWG